MGGFNNVAATHLLSDYTFFYILHIKTVHHKLTDSFWTLLTHQA